MAHHWKRRTALFGGAMSTPPFKPFRMSMGGGLPVPSSSSFQGGEHPVQHIQCENGDFGYKLIVQGVEDPVYYFPLTSGHCFRSWFYTKGDTNYPENVHPAPAFPDASAPLMYQTTDILNVARNFIARSETKLEYNLFAVEEVGLLPSNFPGAHTNDWAIRARQHIHFALHPNSQPRQTPYTLLPVQDGPIRDFDTHARVGQWVQFGTMESTGYGRTQPAQAFINESRIQSIQRIKSDLRTALYAIQWDPDIVLDYTPKYALYHKKDRPDGLHAPDESVTTSGEYSWTMYQSTNQNGIQRSAHLLATMWDNVDPPEVQLSTTSPFQRAMQRAGSYTTSLVHFFLATSVLNDTPMSTYGENVPRMMTAFGNIALLRKRPLEAYPVDLQEDARELMQSGYAVNATLERVVKAMFGGDVRGDDDVQFGGGVDGVVTPLEDTLEFVRAELVDLDADIGTILQGLVPPRRKKTTSTILKMISLGVLARSSLDDVLTRNTITPPTQSFRLLNNQGSTLTDVVNGYTVEGLHDTYADWQRHRTSTYTYNWLLNHQESIPITMLDNWTGRAMVPYTSIPDIVEQFMMEQLLVGSEVPGVLIYDNPSNTTLDNRTYVENTTNASLTGVASAQDVPHNGTATGTVLTTSNESTTITADPSSLQEFTNATENNAAQYNDAITKSFDVIQKLPDQDTKRGALLSLFALHPLNATSLYEHANRLENGKDTNYLHDVTQEQIDLAFWYIRFIYDYATSNLQKDNPASHKTNNELFEVEIYTIEYSWTPSQIFAFNNSTVVANLVLQGLEQIRNPSVHVYLQPFTTQLTAMIRAHGIHTVYTEQDSLLYNAVFDKPMFQSLWVSMESKSELAQNFQNFMNTIQPTINMYESDPSLIIKFMRSAGEVAHNFSGGGPKFMFSFSTMAILLSGLHVNGVLWGNRNINMTAVLERLAVVERGSNVATAVVPAVESTTEILDEEAESNVENTTDGHVDAEPTGTNMTDGRVSATVEPTGTHTTDGYVDATIAPSSTNTTRGPVESTNTGDPPDTNTTGGPADPIGTNESVGTNTTDDRADRNGTNPESGGTNWTLIGTSLTVTTIAAVACMVGAERVRNLAAEMGWVPRSWDDILADNDKLYQDNPLFMVQQHRPPGFWNYGNCTRFMNMVEFKHNLNKEDTTHHMFVQPNAKSFYAYAFAPSDSDVDDDQTHTSLHISDFPAIIMIPSLRHSSMSINKLEANDSDIFRFHHGTCINYGNQSVNMVKYLPVEDGSMNAIDFHKFATNVTKTFESDCAKTLEGGLVRLDDNTSDIVTE